MKRKENITQEIDLGYVVKGQYERGDSFLKTNDEGDSFFGSGQLDSTNAPFYKDLLTALEALADAQQRNPTSPFSSSVHAASLNVYMAPAHPGKVHMWQAMRKASVELAKEPGFKNTGEQNWARYADSHMKNSVRTDLRQNFNMAHEWDLNVERAPNTYFVGYFAVKNEEQVALLTQRASEGFPLSAAQKFDASMDQLVEVMENDKDSLQDYYIAEVTYQLSDTPLSEAEITSALLEQAQEHAALIKRYERLMASPPRLEPPTPN